MRHHLKTAVKLLLLIVVAGAAYYHFRLSPVPVQTASPKTQDLMETVFGTGTLEAKTVVSISPRSTGQLAEPESGEFAELLELKKIPRFIPSPSEA